MVGCCGDDRCKVSLWWVAVVMVACVHRYCLCVSTVATRNCCVTSWSVTIVAILAATEAVGRFKPQIPRGTTATFWRTRMSLIISRLAPHHQGVGQGAIVLNTTRCSARCITSALVQHTKALLEKQDLVHLFCNGHTVIVEGATTSCTIACAIGVC